MGAQNIMMNLGILWKKLMIVRKLWSSKKLMIVRKFWWSSENSDDRQKVLMVVRKFWGSSENSYDREKILIPPWAESAICVFFFCGEMYLNWCIIQRYLHNFTRMKVVHLFAHAFLDYIKGTGPLISQCYWCLLVSFWHSDKSNFCRWQITEEKSQKNEEL